MAEQILLGFAIFILVGSSMLIWIVYTLFFHPLAKVPGPFWAKISATPGWIHAWRGDRHVWEWQLHQRYGPKVRIEPNAVIFNTPDAYREIYSVKANVKKGKFYNTPAAAKGRVTMFVVTDRKEHAWQRRMAHPAFERVSLPASSEWINRHVDRWIELLLSDEGGTKEDWLSPVNLQEQVLYLIIDITAEMVAGRSLDAKEPGDRPSKRLPEIIHGFQNSVYKIGRSPFRDLYVASKPYGTDVFRNYLFPDNKRFAEATVDFMKERFNRQNVARGPSLERLDMFDALYNAKDPETGLQAFDTPSLAALVGLMFVGGTESTSVTLCALLFYITRPEHAHRYSKLVTEIRTNFSSVDDITYASPSLNACTYLRACLDETLRLSHPLCAELSRDVLPGGITIGGETYPPNTTVGASIYAVHLNESVYGDATVWRPERWVVSDAWTAADVARIREGFFPFAAGPAQCPGRAFAIMEITLAVARTLYRCDVRRAPGKEGEMGGGGKELMWGRRNSGQYQTRIFHTAVSDGPVLQFRRRV